MYTVCNVPDTGHPAVVLGFLQPLDNGQICLKGIIDLNGQDNDWEKERKRVFEGKDGQSCSFLQDPLGRWPVATTVKS